MAGTASCVHFEGSGNFRQRIVLAILSGKSVKIKKIRHKDDDPGLQEFESSFMRLIEKVTNGSNFVINETGTTVFFQPGLLFGGSIDHDCNLQRSIGYYLEPLVCLAPFTKKPIKAVLKGITNGQWDPSVDLVKMSTFPMLRRFLGTDEDLAIKIVKRGAAPDGGGEILFSCPCRQKLLPLQFTDAGKVKRVRGVAWCLRTSPAIVNRIVDAARAILNNFLPDVYIYTDHCKGRQAGKSPGFGLTLVAETTKGAFLCAEAISNPKGSEKQPSVPEDVGKDAAKLLLEEIYRGGCVDSTNQGLAVLLMVLGQQDVSKIQTGQLSSYTISFLRHIRDFFQVQFKIDVQQKDCDSDDDDDEAAKKLILTCVGVGYSNISRAIL